ncbi:hypothetical protein BFJ72_g6608 [Fusarium proliferatum]|uniref:F-box domain-containing protein n=1 Tax=Gibberella intermedia TaxID=948311 RepID=A0A420TEM7_GIBIN|nr:hypothetical protein BFJ72_g6608 [Fusarium proliferatum]
MPTEILCMIGDNLSVNEIKDWTLVSKSFREILLPKLCKHLKFSGNMKELTNSLNAYHARKTASFRHLVRRHARLVTFEVTRFNNLREMNAWLQGYGIKSIPIGRFLADTPDLHGIVFIIWLEFAQETRKFLNLIRKGPDWEGPKHLYLEKYGKESTIGKIVGKFKTGTLEGIAVPPNIAYSGRHYDELSRNGSRLTSLRLNAQPARGVGDLSAITSFRFTPIKSISEGFPQLESLNVCDDATHSALWPPHMNDSDKHRLCRRIEGVASCLRNMRRLRRLAFTLQEARFSKNAIDALRTELLDMAMKKGLPPVNARRLEGLCRLLVTYFAAHAKGLDEVCMATKYPIFYRATLTDGAWNISEESSEDPSQKYSFPNVLGN